MGVRCCFRCCWQRRSLRHYGVRPAIEQDAEFVYDLIVQGIQEGHFSTDLLLSDTRAAKQYVTEAIRSGRTVLALNSQFQTIMTCPSSILVYGAPHDDHGRFAYLTIDGMAACDDYRIEFLMAAVRPERRGRRHGRQLVQPIGQLYEADGLVARCHAESIGMTRLLEHIGFRTVQVSSTGIQQMLRPPQLF